MCFHFNNLSNTFVLIKIKECLDNKLNKLLNFIDIMFKLLLYKKVNANQTYLFIKIVKVDTIG